MNCSNCGAKPKSETSKFCSNCGSSMLLPPTQLADQTNPEKTGYMDWKLKQPEQIISKISQNHSRQAIDKRSLKKLIRAILKGSDPEFQVAYKEIKTKRPVEALVGLERIGSKIFLSADRKSAIIELVSAIGTDAAIPVLDRIVSDEEDKYERIAQIGGAKAVDFFVKKSNSVSFIDAKFALLYLQLLNDPAAIRHLVEHAASDDRLVDFNDDSPSVIAQPGLLRKGIVAAVKLTDKHITELRSYGLLTCPGAPIDLILGSTLNVQKTQLALYRAYTIGYLALTNGVEHLDVAWGYAKKSRQAVVLASAYALHGVLDKRVANALNKAISRNNYVGQILAYDAMTKLSTHLDTPTFDRLLQKVLQDKRTKFSVPVAASVLYAGYEPLFDDALRLADHKNKHVRIAMAIPVTLLANEGEPKSMACHSKLSQDANKSVREVLSDLKILTEPQEATE